jgi:hypothetical protein
MTSPDEVATLTRQLLRLQDDRATSIAAAAMNVGVDMKALEDWLASSDSGETVGKEARRKEGVMTVGLRHWLRLEAAGAVLEARNARKAESGEAGPTSRTQGASAAWDGGSGGGTGTGQFGPMVGVAATGGEGGAEVGAGLGPGREATGAEGRDRPHARFQPSPIEVVAVIKSDAQGVAYVGGELPRSGLGSQVVVGDPGGVTGVFSGGAKGMITGVIVGGGAGVRGPEAQQQLLKEGLQVPMHVPAEVTPSCSFATLATTAGNDGTVKGNVSCDGEGKQNVNASARLRGSVGASAAGTGTVAAQANAAAAARVASIGPANVIGGSLDGGGVTGAEMRGADGVVAEGQHNQGGQRRLLTKAFGDEGSLPHLYGPVRTDEEMPLHTKLLLDRSFWLVSSLSQLYQPAPPTPWLSPSPSQLQDMASGHSRRGGGSGSGGGVSKGGAKGSKSGRNARGGGAGESASTVGRCSVCIVQKKGRCGTDTAPLKCLWRGGADAGAGGVRTGTAADPFAAPGAGGAVEVGIAPCIPPRGCLGVQRLGSISLGGL